MDDPSAGQSAPKVLLVSGLLPDPAYASGVFLRDLVDLYPQDLLVRCALVERQDEKKEKRARELGFTTVRIPREQGVRKFGKAAATALRWPQDELLRLAVRGVVRRIGEMAKREEAEALWLPLIGPMSHLIAAPLAESTRLPLYTLVWDPPDYFLADHYVGMTGRRLTYYLERFAEAMKASTRCCAVSDGMKESYEREFGVSCVVLSHGIARSLWQEPRTTPTDARSFVLAYAGTVYPVDHFKALFAALDSVGWEVAGRRIVLRVYNRELGIPVNHPANIELKGWHSSTDIIEKLHEADAGYLAYWSDPEHESVVQKSFPTKLSTYAASGIPTLFHGPRASTPSRFMDEYAIGVVCDSMDSEALLSAIASVASRQTLTDFATECRRALEERLGRDVMAAQFAKFLDIDASVLRTSSGE